MEPPRNRTEALAVMWSPQISKTWNLKILKVQPTGKWKNLTKRCGFTVVVDGRFRSSAVCEEPTLRSSASAFLPPWASLYFTGHNLLVGSCMRGDSVALLLSSLSCFCPPGCVGVWVFAGHRGHLRLNASTSVGSFSSVVDCFSPLDFPVSKVAKFLPNEESQSWFFWTLCGGTYTARILDFWSYQWSGFPVSPFLPPIKWLFFASPKSEQDQHHHLWILKPYHQAPYHYSTLPFRTGPSEGLRGDGHTCCYGKHIVARPSGVDAAGEWW